MKTGLRTATYAALLAMAALVGCKGKEAKTDTPAEEAKPKVKVVQVVVEPVEQLYEYTGTIESFKQNNISPSMPLRIDNIKVEVGDRVSAGQLLAVMDNTQFNQMSLQLANQELELKRVQNLLTAGAVSQQDYDNLKAQVDITRTSVANLKQNMQLTSPINGIITARNYDNGDMFTQLPVLTVMQMQPVKVLINVPEMYYPKVKKGMGVAVKLDTYPDRSFGGNIHLIYPTIDQLTRTFSVEVSIPNSDLTVRPGMFARVELNFGKESHTVIPDLAIQKQEGSNERYVFVIANDTAQRRTVELGRRIGSKFEVLSGVNDGEQVVVAGQSRVLDKIAVEVEK